MDYKDIAKSIVELVGGKENIASYTHCYTRLRMTLNDLEKANKEAISQLDGVLDVIVSGGQFQVVIGNEVEQVYKEVNKLVGSETQKVEVKKKKTVKEYASGALDVFISSFTPIIPLIAGCGMIKVLIAILLNTSLLSDKSSTYVILNILGDSVYYFLPIFVGYTSAKKMDTDPFLGMLLGAILLHPNFSALSAKGAQYTSFINIPVRLVSYSAQALPVILSVWLMKYVNKLTEKICPNLVKVFLRPMITILITAPIMLIVIGPLGTFAGDYFQVFCNLMNKWGWIAVGLNAAIFPFLVFTGMHNALIPLMIQMFATQGFDAVLVPSGLVANIAEGGAAFGVFLRSRDKKMKGTALSATISAIFGITEPALYGVNLKLKRPFIAMLIGSLTGGCLAGLLSVTAFSFVSPSLISLPIFAGTTRSFIGAIITVIATFIGTAVITVIMGFDQSGKDEIVSPLTGELMPLSEVKDKAFASGAMGQGIAIKPTEGKVVAPFNGTVMAIFPTKHAIGLKRDDGLELLIHVGLDTVNLNGKGFKAYVKQGDRVKMGETLLEFDQALIESQGYECVTPIIVTNSAQYKKVDVLASSKIKRKEKLLNVE